MLISVVFVDIIESESVVLAVAGVGFSSASFCWRFSCCFTTLFFLLELVKENNFFFHPVVRRDPSRESFGASWGWFTVLFFALNIGAYGETFSVSDQVW